MKILIADDEDYTREGLIESIPWEDYRIDEIMQAVNGSEAYKIARWFQPDIVLTDIRMPKMDGIEFATQLLEQNPDSRIIFMSGYMEIEYLRSAIRLSAIDYIEKPIDLKVVKKALEKAVAKIQEKQKTLEVSQTHREVQQKKLFSLLTSKEADLKTVEKLAGEAGFLLNQNYVCLMVQIPGREDYLEEVLEKLEDLQGQVLGSYNQDKKEAELLIAFQGKDEYRLGPLYQRLLEAIPECRLGVGMEARDYKGIYNSYRTAGAAMNCAFYQDGQRLFQIDEGILQRSFIEPGIYGEFLQVLAEHPGSLEKWFTELFDQLKEKKYYHKEQVYTLMVSLLTAIYRQFPKLYGECPGILREEDIQPLISGFGNLTKIRQFVEELLVHLSVSQEEQSGYSRVIRGVMDYIAQHYGDEDLSVTSIAEHLHFSPAYLNVLFKQESKVTLKQYLSNYRLEMARKMLEQGYERVTEIAEQCGYANANYFAKVFREVTGCSPAEYRKEKCGK